MVRRKLVIPLVALATMALMLSATGASAAPHETVGELVAECFVNGSVTLDDPIAPITAPADNHYTFRNTGLECEGPKGGTYNVQAEGDTTDIQHQGNGEDCEQGGSATEVQSDGSSDVHSGVLSATGPKDLAGEVHFVRVGTTVLADGPLYEGSTTLPSKPRTPDQWFQAELEFIPDQPCPGTTSATLTGTAEIYEGVVTHNCGTDADKDDKGNHCF